MRGLFVFLFLWMATFMMVASPTTQIDSLRKLDLELLHDSTKAKVYRNLMIHYRKVNLDSSHYYARTLVPLGRKIDDYKLTSTALQGVAYIFWQRSNYDSAIFYFQSAADEAIEAKDSLSASKYFGNVASMYGLIGKHELALEYMFLRLRATEGSNNHIGTARVYNNIAHVYHGRNDYEQALVYARKELTLKLSYGDKADIRESYSTLAALFTSLNSMDSAAHYYRKALQLAHELELKKELSFIYGNLSVFFKQDDPNYRNLDSAKYYAERQLEYSAKYNLPEEKALAHSHLGHYYYDVENRTMALYHHNQAAAIRKELGLIRHYLKSLYSVSVNLKELGRFQEAYAALDDMKSMEDSIHQAENGKALEELKVEYETEQKEKELALKNERINVQTAELANQTLIRNGAFIGLGVVVLIALLLYRNYRIKAKNNLEIASKNDQLQVALTERESLLKEIHHRVKNNLQIIASLLYLQSEETESQNVKQLLEQGQGRVRSMALIHQKLYENEDLKSIPFEEYLDELISEIQRSFGESAAAIQLEVSAKDIFFDVETAVPLGLIINELSTNAFKYAFNNQLGGAIKVHIYKKDDEYEMEFSDNGIGIPDHKLNDPTSSSLGLKLTRMLSEQIEGEYSFSNEAGTTFELIFSAA